MRPESRAATLLSITRSKAKMYEFQVPVDHHIALPVNPNQLFALAVGMLGDAAAAIATNSPEDPRRLTPREALRFSATYFDAYINAKLDAAIAPEFGVLASAAYYLSESPGNAFVILKSVNEGEAPDQSALYTLAYRLLLGKGGEINGAMYGDLPQGLLAALNRYYLLEAEADEVIGRAGQLREIAYIDGSDRDILYADIAMAVCRLKIAASSRSVLPETSGLTLEQWKPVLLRRLFPRELWPAQQKIAQAGLLSGASGVVQMPTSAGKTRATELIIRSAFLSGRSQLAVIVAPFRALCHDIRSDLAVAFEGENIILDEATDAYSMDLIFDLDSLPKTVLIVTPEKLLYILRRAPELALEIGLLLYDEGHLFDSKSRGVTYELLLTSLKLLIQPGTQVILISAVIENAGAVAGWLVGDETRVIDGKGLMPTSKSIAFASWTAPLGQLRYVVPSTPDEEEFFVPRVIERLPLTYKNGNSAGTYPTEEGRDVGLYLGLRLVGNGAIAIFCGAKATVAKICKTAVKNYKLSYPTPAPSTLSDETELAALVRHFAFHLGSASVYTGAAKRGIFGHHGSIPQGVRLCIEHAMKERLIRFVVCTSTLGQGVNLPIKYLIVTSTQQGEDRILVRDFHNLIGRAGRAGMHTEGSVIFASPNIYDGRSEWSENWRWRAAKELLNQSNSEPCGSNILYAFLPFIDDDEEVSVQFTMENLVRLAFEEVSVTDDLIDQYFTDQADDVIRQFQRNTRNRARIIQSVASYILAHIDFEVEDWSEQLVTLVSNTLAYHIADEGQRHELTILFEALSESVREHADEEETRVLLKKSPLAAEGTLRARAWLRENADRLIEALDDGGLFQVVYEYIRERALPAQFANLSNMDSIETIGEMWLDERTYHEIFVELKAIDLRIGRGARPRKVTIDHVVAFCENAYGYEAAMVVAAMSDAAEEIDANLATALATLQKQMKYGLDSNAAIAFYEAGFADRRVSIGLGALFPAVSDRSQARATIRANRDLVRDALAEHPAYFREVLREMTA